jgi:type IV pilus biogenesis/stability protein PilW
LRETTAVRKWLSVGGAVAVGLVLAGCRHGPDPQEAKAARNYYELGLLAQKNGRIPEAYSDLKKALELDDSNAEIHLAMGLLMQLDYNRPQDAITQYQRAIELDPGYTEARVNLGTVYLQQGAYEKAIPLFQSALEDLSYRTPYIAESDLGWALFKSGKVEEGREHLARATRINPQFCLPFRQLGEVAESQHDTHGACEAYRQYESACSQSADAAYRVAVCEAKLGNVEASAAALAACAQRKGDPALVDECRGRLERTSRPDPATPVSESP